MLRTLLISSLVSRALECGIAQTQQSPKAQPFSLQLATGRCNGCEKFASYFMNIEWLYGLVHLTWLSYALLSIAMVETTLLAVTLYLHRDATHRSIDLHPALRHFFRFWIWMTSSMLTREWVAVHRKHHAFADRAGDPHSPVNVGLRRILLEGTEFYRREARNPNTQENYGKGAPDDWIERNVYSRHRNAGIVAFVVVELVLFGVPGIILIAVQMISMPVLAAGVINGIGHSIGYRNYEVKNASTNIVPWGIFIGGEELHNNHHAFPSSAKFSMRRWEFDLGWLYIVVLQSFGLAKVKRLAPRSHVIASEQPIDSTMPDRDAAYEVIRNRMHVLRAYAVQVIVPVVKFERGSKSRKQLARISRKLLIRSPILLDAVSRNRLQAMLENYPSLKTIYECQEQLRQLCETINPTKERLVAMFNSWCTRAESSGIQALQEFAGSLRGVALVAKT
jgi:stearoyl-CoA desaturase (delta-9 desaturase)